MRRVSDHEHLIQSITTAFPQINCERNKHHGPYEFICTAPDCPDDRLVCADCFKTDTRHIQNHGRHFVRVQQFATMASELGYTGSRKQKDIELLKDTVRKIEKCSKVLDGGYSNDAEKIKGVFRRLEVAMIGVIQHSVKLVCEEVLANFRNKWESDKRILWQYLQDCSQASGLENFGYLRDLEALLKRRSGSQAAEFREKAQQIVNMYHNHDYLVNGILNKYKPLTSKSEESFRLSVDFKAFDIYSARIVDELEIFLQDLVPDPFTGKIKSKIEQSAELEHLPRSHSKLKPKTGLLDSQSKDLLRVPSNTNQHPLTLSNSVHILSSKNLAKKRQESIDKKMDELLNFPQAAAAPLEKKYSSLTPEHRRSRRSAATWTPRTTSKLTSKTHSPKTSARPTTKNKRCRSTCRAS